MQTSGPDDPSWRVAPGAAAPDASISVATKQDPNIELQATQRPDTKYTTIPDESPSTCSQDQTLNTNEGVQSSSFHQTHVLAGGNLHQSQNGVSESGEHESMIQDLLEKLDRYREKSEMASTRAQETENELKNIRAQAQETKNELENIRAQAQETKNELENSRSQAQEAEIELKNIRAQAQETENELKNSRAQVKNLVKEFNKAKVHSQSHMIHHVTDSELSEKVEGLRYNISNMTIQYFVAGPPTFNPLRQFQSKHPDSKTLFKYLGLRWDAFSNLMQSQSPQRTSIVQALIWAVLCGKLFGKFAWIDHKVACAIEDMKDFLHSDVDFVIDGDRLQALRRWNTWRANTSIIILEALAAETRACQSQENDFYERNIRPIEEILKPFTGAEHNTFATELRRIVHEAIELDKVMNKQIPALTWIFRPTQLPDEYSQDDMEFDLESQSEMPQKDDWLIVNPGLQKRGKSTGQDFDQATVLFKTKFHAKPSAVPTASRRWTPRNQRTFARN
ncbi:hypothetical protein E8E14_006814 [Neopestalotiopsis sp. 37M]|nr:hypothetical protein E8E14_006814 [Neopestalotiopsis sp. 37M]